MPKKEQKSKEEIRAENFFPLKEKNLEFATEKKIPEREIFREEFKQTTEKSVKEKGTEKSRFIIEKSSKKVDKKELTSVLKEGIKTNKTKKKISKKKTKKAVKKNRIKKAIDFFPEKIELNKNGYELIITEKPQAATKIATALGEAIQKTNNKVSYYEVNRNGKKIMVACAVGHLFTLKQIRPGAEVPTFEIKWVPNFLNNKTDFTKKYYDTILKLVKGASTITVATDFDVEGEVIGWNVVRFICGQTNARRMKFSTLTKEELNSAYENASSEINWGQAYAGETRHYLDWFYGINLSRALMNAIKTTGRFKIMSIGRVQGPTLNLIVDKEKEIQNFVSQKYWQVLITISDGKNKIELKYKEDIFKEEELEKFQNLKGKEVEVKTEKKEEQVPPNPPFNLTTLQTEAYKFYGITPSKTLQIAQSLYLSGLISYPRTSSQKLPASIGYLEILKKIARDFNVEHLISKKIPIEGKKTDPAHPSIYPTGNKQILSGDEEKIYNLIARRFLALFCSDAILEKKKIIAKYLNFEFNKTGMTISQEGWKAVYPTKEKYENLPNLNGKAKIIDEKIEEKQTQPPKRYSPASLLSLLEKKNLGTKATRSQILETLYDRGYVQDTSIKATPIGISLIDALKKYSPIITDEKLTRKLEEEMESINALKENYSKKEEEIIGKAKKIIIKIIEQFNSNLGRIGGELIQAQMDYRQQQKIENQITKCPKCQKGNLIINYSKKNRKYFVACDAYPECKNTFSLPPNGIIKKTEKFCEECQFPMLMRLSKGRKPWIFCFNPQCPTNAKWASKREEN